MSDKHDNFDEQKMFERKEHYMGFQYCPRCSAELTEGDSDGITRLFCPNPDCDYVYYQNPTPAAGALIVEGEKVLLVRRAHPPRIGWWCIPAGFMEWTEHPTDTAIRELKEETGLDVELKGFFQVYSGKDDPRSNSILLLYLADRVGGELGASDDAEEAAWYHLDDLPDNIAFISHRQALADYNRRYRQG